MESNHMDDMIKDDPADKQIGKNRQLRTGESMASDLLSPDRAGFQTPGQNFNQNFVNTRTSLGLDVANGPIDDGRKLLKMTVSQI